MVTKISFKEVEKRLEKAVAKFNLTEEFLGPNKDSFLRAYMALQSQIRKGDKLKIEIIKKRYCNSHREFYYPDFQIFLYKSDGAKEPVRERIFLYIG